LEKLLTSLKEGMLPKFAFLSHFTGFEWVILQEVKTIKGEAMIEQRGRERRRESFFIILRIR
jgi:hypothetical protein